MMTLEDMYHLKGRPLPELIQIYSDYFGATPESNDRDVIIATICKEAVRRRLTGESTVDSLPSDNDAS